jgi:hypothetical protein
MKPLAQPAPHTYRPDIDGLRAIAISSVVAYHAGLPGFSGGFVGVDVFFVISGFLITRLLIKEIEETGGLSFSKFYSRRFKRLMPAFLAMMLGTLILILWFTPGLEDSDKFIASIKWSAIGLANLFFKRNTGGYFDGPSEEMPLLHLWSLSVEEQFYFFWPLLLMIPIWFSKGRTVVKKATPVLLCGVTLISFLSALISMKHKGESDAFYLMPYRAWELGIGGLLSLFSAPKVSGKLPEGTASLLSVAGLGSIFYGVIAYSHQTPFPGITALAPVLGTAALILGGALSTNPVSKLLSNQVFIKIGVLSYGWYLWHWPLLALLKIWNLGSTPSPFSRGIAVLAALLLAEISLRWIETPFRLESFWKSLSPRRTIMMGISLSVLVGLIGFRFVAIEDRFISRHVDDGIIKKVREHTSLNGKCFTKSEVGSPTCSLQFSKNPAQTRELAIWGDSHACSYFPMIEALGETHSINVTQYCQGQTPPFYSGSEDTFEGSVFKDLKKKLREGKKISLVLVARWVPYSNKKPIALETHQFPNFGSESQSLIEMKSRLAETLQQLKAIGVDRVLIILPYPEFKYRTLRCLFRNTEACETRLDEIRDYQAPLVTLLNEVAKDDSFVRLLDPMPVVCNTHSCPQVLDGIPITSDSNHPTVAAVKRITEAKGTELGWLIGAP